MCMLGVIDGRERSDNGFNLPQRLHHLCGFKGYNFK